MCQKTEYGASIAIIVSGLTSTLCGIFLIWFAEKKYIITSTLKPVTPDSDYRPFPRLSL